MTMNQPQAQGAGTPMGGQQQAGMGPSMGGQQQVQGIGSPISNECYNVLTALQSKLKGLETYRKYAQSGGNAQLWQYLTQLDTQAVQVLSQQVEQMAQSGQLRFRQPTQTGQPVS
jgi:hypothetical protein